MSVIIKGMDMPSSCADCKLIIYADGTYVCPFSGIMALNIGRQDSCPLVEIPSPHGKIIDADAEIKRYGLDKATKYGNKTEEELNFSYSQMLMYEIAGLFENAPTILDAEEGEETLKIPKTIDALLKRRTRQSCALNRTCGALDDWLKKKNIDPDPACWLGGVETYAHPFASEVRRAIEEEERGAEE